MDKEKEIEAIVQHACNREGVAKRCPQRIAEALIDAGYGNVKQAVEEFAEEVKKALIETVSKDGVIIYHITPARINNLIKKLYSEGDNDN